MASKSSKREKSGGGVQQFLVWHGEKIIVGIVVVVALVFVWQGLGYKTLSWQPNELETTADAARKAIEENTRIPKDEGVDVFDFSTYAEQIKERIPTDPYRSSALWNPSPIPSASSGSGGSGMRTSMDYE